MITHVYPFFADGINYRLIVSSKLLLESWTDQRWKQVPTGILGGLLDRLAELGDMESGFHTILFRNIGMRIEVIRRSRWWGRKPQIDVQYLDLDEPDPWVSVDPEDPIDDLPVIVGASAIVYRNCHPAGVWGIWAVLKKQGYIAQSWAGDSLEEHTESCTELTCHNPEDDN